MDPLQEAIDKARREGDGSIGRTGPPGKQTDTQRGTANPSRASRTGQESASTDTLPRPSDVQYTSTRVVKLNAATLAENRIIAGDPYDSRAEIYRQLRSQVLRSMKANNWQTLSITSAHENAGKTLTAINLAISISQEVSQTVMLVDLDFLEPSIHTTLGIDVEKGILDHVLHGESLQNIMINPSLPRLVILPGLPQQQQVSEILSSPEMEKFYQEIIARYPDRLVIFDLPPLLRNDDAMVFAPYTDACLLVVEDGVTSASDLERSLQLLQSSQVLGTVLNKVL